MWRRQSLRSGSKTGGSQSPRPRATAARAGDPGSGAATTSPATTVGRPCSVRTTSSPRRNDQHRARETADGHRTIGPSYNHDTTMSHRLDGTRGRVDAIGFSPAMGPSPRRYGLCPSDGGPRRAGRYPRVAVRCILHRHRGDGLRVHGRTHLVDGRAPEKVRHRLEDLVGRGFSASRAGVPMATMRTGSPTTRSASCGWGRDPVAGGVRPRGAGAGGDFRRDRSVR